MILRIKHLLMCLLLAIAAPAWAQSTIALRASARVDPVGSIRLADVADLSGAEAQELAGVVIIGDPRSRSGATRGSFALGIEDVRSAIEAHARRTHPIPWARLVLRGSVCRIRVGAPVGRAESSRRSAEPRTSAVLASSLLKQASVRALLAERISQIAQADPQDVRLTFRRGDGPVLDLSLDGRKAVVKPTGLSDTLPILVNVYEGDRIVATSTVRVGVQVQRDVAVAARRIARRQIVNPGDLRTERRWLPLTARPAPAGRVVGSELRARIDAGEIVLEHHVQPPIVVNRGDRVVVHCLSGSVVIKVEAVARSSARDGQLVELEMPRSGQRIQARMSGRGQAVIVTADGSHPRSPGSEDAGAP